MFAIVREPKMKYRQGYVIHVSFAEDVDKVSRLERAVSAWREQWTMEYKRPYAVKIDMVIGLRI